MSITWQSSTLDSRVVSDSSIARIAKANCGCLTSGDCSYRAIYNFTISFMSRVLRSSRTALCNLLVILFLLVACAVAATDWSQLERDLSAKISGATGPGAISLELQNRASLTKGEL